MFRQNDLLFKLGTRGLAALLFLLAIHAVPANAQTIKHFQWGVESWLSKVQDLTIQFNETAPVYLIAVEGNLTASPNASFSLSDNVSRQTLVTLINVGTSFTPPVQTLGTPAGTNHGVSAHAMAVNAKVTGSTAVVVPINFRFDEAPILLPAKRLTWHVDNSSWRSYADGTGYRDASYLAGIDTEIQVTVTYRVGP